HDLIDESAAAAARLGYDGNHRFTTFGPTNVALYRISIAQVLGDNGAAIEHAKTVRPSAIGTPERRGRYWIDLARAYHQWGKPERCYQALLRAEQAAPADVRYRPPVHRMVEDLLRADRRRVGRRLDRDDPRDRPAVVGDGQGVPLAYLGQVPAQPTPQRAHADFH